jgi:beta-glucosidase/6-phospho-beta-glucosidase/beta-galactosidase
LWPTETIRIVAQMPQKGIFLTGIENADPFVDGVRRNQLREAHDFYQNYEDRLQKIKDLGITWLRFGAPYSDIHIGPNEYDFTLVDQVVKKCDELGITIVADLLHFGLPDWLHHEAKQAPYFQNLYFPVELARYASVFAARYPQIKFYTPVNEPFVTAFLSAKLGIWNEQLYGENWQDDRYFVRAAANIAKAAILARKAIEEMTPEAIFIQNESFELAIAMPGSNRETEARQFNLRRFVCMDLITGYRDEAMKSYLVEQGIPEAEYEWFMYHGSLKSTVLGIDHYPWCIHEYYADKSVDHDVSQQSKLFDLIEEYWERYPMPLLHTEANALPEHAVRVCQETFDILGRLRTEGYPVLGMGWFGDDLQVGWQVALRGDAAFDEYPVGLYYKGELQPVGELYANLAQLGLPAFDHREAKLRMKKMV